MNGDPARVALPVLFDLLPRLPEDRVGELQRLNDPDPSDTSLPQADPDRGDPDGGRPALAARRPNPRVEGDRGHSRTIQETGELFAKAMNVAAGPKQMTDSLYRARC